MVKGYREKQDKLFRKHFDYKLGYKYCSECNMIHSFTRVTKLSCLSSLETGGKSKRPNTN